MELTLLLVSLSEEWLELDVLNPSEPKTKHFLYHYHLFETVLNHFFILVFQSMKDRKFLQPLASLTLSNELLDSDWLDPEESSAARVVAA